MNLLRGLSGFPSGVIEGLERLGVDERIPVSSHHEWLQAAIGFTKDPDLGLKAARSLEFGDLGTFDYVISTAPSVRAAIEIAGHYKRLINDTVDFHLDIAGEQAAVHLENSVVMPRAALDFQVAVICRNYFMRWPRTEQGKYEVCFAYGEPENTAEYALTFHEVPVRFSASFTGFLFPANDLDKPLESSDSNLHEVVRKYADVTLAGLPKTQSVTERVRELITGDLASGGPYAQRVSRSLNMSARTLIRRLEHEGTTFKEILDDVRRRLALNYMGNRDLELADTAFLLGFSHTTAFHRAFKRWTGQTPLDYRHSRRR